MASDAQETHLHVSVPPAGNNIPLTAHEDEDHILTLLATMPMDVIATVLAYTHCGQLASLVLRTKDLPVVSLSGLRSGSRDVHYILSCTSLDALTRRVSSAN